MIGNNQITDTIKQMSIEDALCLIIEKNNELIEENKKLLEEKYKLQAVINEVKLHLDYAKIKR